MSSLDERQRRLLERILARPHREPLHVGSITTTDDACAFGAALLERGLAQRDTKDVEDGLSVGFRFGFSDQYQSSLEILANEPWHQRHEDVLLALDALIKKKVPINPDVLYRAAVAEHPYRQESGLDDSAALAVKSIWALGNLRTQESVMRLGDLIESKNPIIARNAAYQLDKMLDYSPDDRRRGIDAPSDLVKELARRILDAHPSVPRTDEWPDEDDPTDDESGA